MSLTSYRAARSIYAGGLPVESLQRAARIAGGKVMARFEGLLVESHLDRRLRGQFCGVRLLDKGG
jgi:hypothetical protein